MTNNNARQEVEVTDIRMRFGSMVVFMVKWAIASIPALLILVVAGALFWGITVGLISSMGTRSPLHSEQSSATTGRSTTPTSEEADYLAKVEVNKVKVGKSVLDEPGVFGEIKNSGDRILKTVEITVYCLGPEGKPIFEKKYDPVLVTERSFGQDNQPLKPGYSRQFGYKLDDAPSDWNKQVDVKVTHVEFQ